MTIVVVGDEIVFYYDGMAMETDPLQVSTVYAITLKTPADRIKEELSDLIPMVMVNGELYLDTGNESSKIERTDHWWVFTTEKALASSQMMIETNETKTILFHDKTFNKSDLSQETIEWLEKYNSLSEEEQLAISYIPSELHELCGYPTAEETEAPAE